MGNIAPGKVSWRLADARRVSKINQLVKLRNRKFARPDHHRSPLLMPSCGKMRRAVGIYNCQSRRYWPCQPIVHPEGLLAIILGDWLASAPPNLFVGHRAGVLFNPINSMQNIESVKSCGRQLSCALTGLIFLSAAVG